MTLGRVAPPTSRSSGFRADLQGLRALAVVLVVVFHTGYALPGGFIGVDVFFVLSGFLIIGLLDRETERTGRIDLATFFARRARRLLPALAVVTTATVLASAALVELGSPLRAVTRTAAGASLFVANLVLYREVDYFAPDAERNPLLHMWSLSVEEQFYFVVPVALALMLALHRAGRAAGLTRRGGWIALLGVGSAVSFGLNVLLVDLGGRVPGLQEPVLLAFYAPVTRAWQFGVGGLLALAVADRPLRHVPGLRPLGLTLILVAALLLEDGASFPGVRALLPTIGTLLLLVPDRSERPPGPLLRALTSRPLVTTGDLSYSWYLWHWPAIVLGRAALGDHAVVVWGAVVVSFGLALLSLRLVEARFRTDARLIGARAARLAAVCIAVPLIAALTVSAVNERVAERVGLGLSDRSWSRDACHVGRDHEGGFDLNGCTRGRQALDSPRVDVLLIGDSHADSLSDGVLAATERLGLSLGVRTVNGQPPLGDEGWVQRHRELIATTEPAVVILTARSTRYVESLLDRWLPEGDAERTGASIEEVWIEELLAAVQGFRALGPQVIVVQNVPEFPERERARATLLTVYRHQEISLADLQAQRGELLALERLVLADLDGVIVLDPAESLCTPECRSGAEDRFFYYDSNHLSPEGSRLVADQLARALREATGR